MWKSSDFVNDADYTVKPTIDGKRVHCPYYVTWTAMKRRCCAEEYKRKNPTYTDVTCCEEWLSFMTFRAWMGTKNWIGMDLDKDILYPNNRIYSPETCRFVPHLINSVFRDTSKAAGKFPFGVHYIEDKDNPLGNKKNYMCQVYEFGKGQQYKGVYATSGEAHSVWQINKIQFLKGSVEWWKTDTQVMDSFQEDVAKSILDRSAVIWQDYLNGVETKYI